VHTIDLTDLATPVGRDQATGLSVSDERMSRTHAYFKIDLDSGRAMVKDEASRNGTYVNGTRVPESLLESGDVVRIGDTIVAVEEHCKDSELIDVEDELQNQIKGHSHGVRLVRQSIRKVGHSDLTALILGESGTGKELVAAELHRHSNRTGELVAVNCAGIPETLAESTLFGHVRGAFTGATDDRMGVFVQAHEGTLFLDEVGELPLAVQTKLLRVLEDRFVTPVGGSRGRRVDTRIVAATNRPLRTAVNDETFRGDLLARLEEWPIHMPLLHERRVDIPYLFSRFLAEDNESPHSIHPDAMEALLLHNWPFNVRELRKLARRLTIAIENNVRIALTDLPQEIQNNFHARRGAKLNDDDVKAPLSQDEIITALRRMKGNVSKAARYLSVSRKTMYRRLSEYSINAEAYRD
jgi:DNA-binding NtrC family response regulator